MFDFQSPLLLLGTDSDSSSLMYFSSCPGSEEGDRAVRFSSHMAFLGLQQKSTALMLTSHPSKPLLEFLGGPFMSWSVWKAQDTSMAPWVKTTEFTEPVNLHTWLGIKQGGSVVSIPSK